MPRVSAKAEKAKAKGVAPQEAAPEPLICPLCGRPMLPGPTVDEHHLLPKAQKGRDKFLVHRICHTKIHATLSEKELARRYHTWEALRAQPEIAAFIEWVKKKPPGYVGRNITAKAKR
ncbi:MAG TPA: hypothetical protein VGN52_22500 [Burkholderiales bacterium]|jgi:hypothetical protein